MKCVQKKLTSDVMYVLKCATIDYVLAKKSDSENMTSEELRKVLEKTFVQQR